jgi:hypothetical protein
LWKKFKIKVKGYLDEQVQNNILLVGLFLLEHKATYRPYQEDGHVMSTSHLIISDLPLVFINISLETNGLLRG